jgi:hypothetical protein
MHPIGTTFIKFVYPVPGFIIGKPQPLSIQLCPEICYHPEIISGGKNDSGRGTLGNCIVIFQITYPWRYRINKCLNEPKSSNDVVIHSPFKTALRTVLLFL